MSAVDKAADAGISENTRTYGAIIADFDNDTKPDIFLGRHGEQPRLYENAGNGHFQETNQGTFARADRHGCDAADVNGDGLKDIFCTEGAPKEPRPNATSSISSGRTTPSPSRPDSTACSILSAGGVRPSSSTPMATAAPTYS